MNTCRSRLQHDALPIVMLKWRKASAKERSAYQEHFIDLCRLLGHETPMEADPSGRTFAFEAGRAKPTAQLKKPAGAGPT